MKEFSSLSLELQGMIGITLFILQWGLLFLLFLGIYIKQYDKCKWAYLLFLLGIANIYFLSQAVAESVTGKETNEKLIRLLEKFKATPYIFIILILVLYLAAEILLLFKTINFRRSHITAISLKQAVDDLTVGLCYMDEHGRVRLKNNFAEEISILLTKKPLVNGLELYRKIENSDLADEIKVEPLDDRFLVFLKDERVLSVFKEELVHNGEKLYLLSISNISEEYRKTRTLKEYQDELIKANRGLVDYNKQIMAAITEKEILAAKVKIHDELGINLIAAKKYVLEGGPEDEKEKILLSLRQNLEFLRSEVKTVKKDMLLKLTETAKELGVEIILDGTIPEKEVSRDITLNAIHECLTNAIRYARADKLYVKITSQNAGINVIIKNNGRKPEEIIKEGGGLGSLRKMIENAGGTMEINQVDGFELIFTLV